MQKALFLKDFNITFLGTKINELEVEIEETAQRFLLKKNELE